MNRNPLPLLILSAALSLPTSTAIGQNPPTVTQEAKGSPCSNIVALVGDVKLDCSSLTPAQQKIIESIPAVLHKILANHLDPDAVMGKLDELARQLDHIDRTMPRQRDFDPAKFQDRLREYRGIPINGVSISIDTDRLTPFVMKLAKALNVTGPNLIDNGTYTNPLTIQFSDSSSPGSADGAREAAKFLQEVLSSFGISSTVEPSVLGAPNWIRIRVSSQLD
jgi:hypothetical protein